MKSLSVPIEPEHEAPPGHYVRMSPTEWMVLAAGLALLFASAPWHLGGLLLIKRLKPADGDHSFLALLGTFWGLMLLHLTEIAIAAWAYWAVMQFPDTGNITHWDGSSMASLLYFSGVTFATLGFTSQHADGPIRMIVMLEALGGFMLITWSATFVYSIWSERFRSSDDSE